jgi:hypothetical protein
MAVLFMISDLVQYIESNDPNKKISLELILNGMTSEDFEVMGAIYCIISSNKLYKNIHPPMSWEQCIGFLMNYFKCCIIDSPDGDWSDSRYTAAWDYANWIRFLFYESWANKYIQLICKDLEHLYMHSSEKIKNCIEVALYEHIFNDPKIKLKFIEYTASKEMSAVYARCSKSL